MSATSSLSSALSGLSVASRKAEVIASNIANAATPGYGRRVLETAARQVGSTGQGVMATGVTRIVNQNVINERRLSDAEAAQEAGISDFYKTLESAIGTPDDEQSLNGRIDAFDRALLSASSSPESAAHQDIVAQRASALADRLNQISDKIQDERASADQQIATQVQQLTDGLNRIADLNAQIRAGSNGGSDVSALMDQRQQLVDGLSSILPMREMMRDNGQIALITTGGMILLEGSVAKFEFEPVGVVSAEMTLQSGALSPLRINGRTIDVTGVNSQLGGGSLTALFQVRDVDGVRAQTDIDAVARDLIERFQDPALDATRAPGDPGLFTDGNSAFDSVNELGIAQRIRLNAAVDPDRGGQLWKLRDGLGAVAPGPPGNAALLVDLQAALNAARSPASGSFMTGERSFSELSSDLTSSVATERLSAEGNATYAQSRAATMKQMEMENGVDTDKEMQDLLEVEKAYAANAKVMQTIDDMIKRLLDI